MPPRSEEKIRKERTSRIGRMSYLTIDLFSFAFPERGRDTAQIMTPGTVVVPINPAHE